LHLIPSAAGAKLVADEASFSASSVAHFSWGVSMKLGVLPAFVALVCSFLVYSCSGLKTACNTNCGPGTAKVSFTMVADTLPAHPALLSFTVVVTGITLTSSTGATTNLTPPSSPIDLMRLQSDSAFLGTLSNAPIGTNSSITVAISAQQLTFLNDTGVALTTPACAVNAVCSFKPATSGSPVITFAQNISGNTGFGIDVNLANSITITGTTVSVNLTNSATNNVLSAFTLPRGSNLAAGQLDLIEDFTGVVSVSGQSVTITSPARGTLTATASSSTNFDPDPSNTHCATGTTSLSACVSNGEIASLDAVLQSDGTMAIQEIEPLVSSTEDIVEGTITSITSQTQFALVTTDKVQAATGSLISALNVGDPLTINLPFNANGFQVDTKGLRVGPAITNFQNGTNTTSMHSGQTMDVHVTAFTAASGSTIASANVDSVILRWSRFTASVANAASPAFNITGLPAYFAVAQGASFEVQTFTGTPGADGVTNFDGVADASGLSALKSVALRTLYLQNTTNSAAPVFFAAKIRQH
jgi:hypothetical protein